MNRKLLAALKLIEISLNNSKAYSELQEELLNNPEKLKEYCDKIEKGQEDAIRKEIKSLESASKKFILK